MTAGTGPESGPPGLGELLATFQAWNSRDTLAAAARRADAAGEPERAARARVLLAADPAGPAALDALAAQHKLASLLGGWRWQTVAAAREQGASWAEIARVTGSDAASARAKYVAQVEQVERETARAGLAMPEAERARYHAAGGDDPPDAPLEDRPGNPPDECGHRAAEEITMHEHATTGDDQRAAAVSPPRRDPVPDEALVSGTITLPGGLPPGEDDHVHTRADTGAAAEVADGFGRWDRQPPSSATLAAVAERLDREGWSEDQARALEYLEACRALADERGAAVTRGDLATVAVADADRAWLDEAYQDYTVPRTAAATRARLAQEPPLSNEGHARIEQWAADSVTAAGRDAGEVRDGWPEPRGDGPEIARRYAHALLGLDPHAPHTGEADDDMARDDRRGRSDHAVSVDEPGAGAGSWWWPVPDRTLPAPELSDRELIARAGHCDEVIATGSRADQAAARADLDAAWAEAEHRAAEAGPDSVAAQVAGYLSLVRDDDKHALADEAGRWRAELDALLPPPVVAEAGPDDPGWERGDDAASWSGVNPAAGRDLGPGEARVSGRATPDLAATGLGPDELVADAETPTHARSLGGAAPASVAEAIPASRPLTSADVSLLFAALDEQVTRERDADDARQAQLASWHHDDHDRTQRTTTRAEDTEFDNDAVSEGDARVDGQGDR